LAKTGADVRSIQLHSLFLLMVMTDLAPTQPSRCTNGPAPPSMETTATPAGCLSFLETPQPALVQISTEVTER
jgi:hypothetical protein